MISIGRYSARPRASGSPPARRRPRCWSRKSSTPSAYATRFRSRACRPPTRTCSFRCRANCAKTRRSRNMAVYTDVGEEELAKFLAGYDLGALLSCKGIAEGVENTNYLLHTGAGYFILTLYEKRVAKAELPFFLGLMEHLATRGINCPQPVKNKKGNALAELAGRPAALVTFLEGVSVRRPNVSHCTAVGRALAQLHLAGNDFKLHRRNVLGLSGWEPLARTAGKGRAEGAPGGGEILPR